MIADKTDTVLLALSRPPRTDTPSRGVARPAQMLLSRNAGWSQPKAARRIAIRVSAAMEQDECWGGRDKAGGRLVRLPVSCLLLFVFSLVSCLSFIISCFLFFVPCSLLAVSCFLFPASLFSFLASRFSFRYRFYSVPRVSGPMSLTSSFLFLLSFFLFLLS